MRIKILSQFVLVFAVVMTLVSCGGGGGTGGEDKKLIVEGGQQKVFKEFWDIFDRYYPLMFRKDLDWQKVYETYSTQVSSAKSDDELFDIFDKIMTTVVKDGHSHVVFGEKEATYLPEINEDIQRMVEDNTPSKINFMNNSQRNAYLAYGTLVSDSDIGYISAKRFEPLSDNEQELEAYKRIVDEALLALQGKSGIILDVRENGGGQAPFAYYLAGRFLSSNSVDVVRRRYKVREGSTEASLSDWVLTQYDAFDGYTDARSEAGTVGSTDADLNTVQASGSFQYEDKVALLTSRQTASAAEYFTVAMKSQSHVKSFGNTTFGIFAGSELFTLKEGDGKWKANVSVHDVEVKYGGVFKSLEGTGVAPDERLLPTASQVDAGRDIHIEAAVSYINQ